MELCTPCSASAAPAHVSDGAFPEHDACGFLISSVQSASAGCASPSLFQGDRRDLSGKAMGLICGVAVGQLHGAASYLKVRGYFWEDAVLMLLYSFLPPTHHERIRRHYFAQGPNYFTWGVSISVQISLLCGLFQEQGPPSPTGPREGLGDTFALCCFPLDQVGDVPTSQHAGEGVFY